MADPEIDDEFPPELEISLDENVESNDGDLDLESNVPSLEDLLED